MKNNRQPDKILGVLGGMGLAAAAEFLRLLAERAPVSRDQEHAVTHLLSDPPGARPEQRHSRHGGGSHGAPEEEPPHLAGWGADFLAVPRNTAHFFIDRFRRAAGTPHPHHRRDGGGRRKDEPRGCVAPRPPGDPRTADSTSATGEEELPPSSSRHWKCSRRCRKASSW